MKLKQHIAVLLSSVAMLTLLFHGFIPHHHHDIETEQCQIEAQQFSSDCQSCCDHSIDLGQETNLSAHQHHQDPSNAHVCNFNSEKIKNVSVAFAVIVKILTIRVCDEKPQTITTQYAGRITISPPPECPLLRAPPLG
jgi:trehalose/maltose hydrolase-like predicted phosphorylase